MKSDVPWLFLSESVIYFLPVFIRFYEDHDKEFSPGEVEEFSKSSLRDIFNQRLVTTSADIWS